MRNATAGGRSHVYAVGIATVLVATILVATRMDSPAVATSGGGDPYQVPVAVDTNPSPTTLETTIVADETPGVAIGNNVTANVLTFNGTIPGPELRLHVGDTVIVHYENHLDHPSGIHWHGIELDNASDGTPLTQNMVPPGGKFLYKFIVPRAGIFWYHPHHHSSTNQVFKGLYGSIVVTDPAEATLQTEHVLPPQADTRTMVLSDITVCHAGPDDSQTYPDSSPHISGATPFPAQMAPHPSDLCDTPIDEDGAAIGSELGEGDVPNIQRTSGNSNEGRIVLTNGKNVGGRDGTQSAPGDLSDTAVTTPVAAGSGQRFQLINAAAIRFFRLRLTDDSGALVPLVRIGGEGGLLDSAVVDGGHSPYEWNYDAGEIVLGPGERADVVAAIPASATGTLTMWQEDFKRTGGGNGAGGWANLPTVPVAHLGVTGAAPAPAFTIGAGTPILADPGVARSVETLPAPTGGFITPAGGFVAPKLGMASQQIELNAMGSGSDTFINGVKGTHDSPGDYTAAPTIGSTRYAAHVGDTLELTVKNATGAHHPFHPHGFSVQPLTLENPPGTVLYTFPRDFQDEVDVPGNTTLRYRVRLDDRPLMDGVTPGGAYGRWVFHCHIFFHAVFGMISEIIVTDGSGNERPYVNADGVETAEVFTGDPVSMTGKYVDVEHDAVTLSASAGTVTDNGDGTWSWHANATTNQLVYITATEAGGLKDQIAFEMRVKNSPPVVHADAASVTVNEGTTATNTGTVSDPDGDPVTLTASVGSVTDNGNGTWSWSFATTDGPDQSQTVTVTADDGQATTSTTFALTVNNVPPTVSISSPATGALYPVGSTVSLVAPVFDPGLDTVACTVDWDDGAGPGAPVSASGGACTAAKTITAAGVYTVVVVARDSDGASSLPASTMVVVYDPSAGFVTGGGTLNSPAGAYAADPSLAGKANFGFESKYQKGATVPKGNTEFDFKAGTFRFSSTTYQWLVVAGAKAQYKGFGTVNGSGNYGFLLTATDGQAAGGGGVDKLRLKVWDAATSAVVYDNAFGSSEDIDVANPQAIANGSIVIHS
ncbi:MAG TPA: multicopper oxidase domain-containing protein [Acidimicrobiales bacterium]|nr:multicopper oxidase domain-containing protein [Acidimicrobiales bacterium]